MDNIMLLIINTYWMNFRFNLLFYLIHLIIIMIIRIIRIMLIII